MDASNISILIPTYHPDLALFEKCLASIRLFNRSHPQIVVGLQGDASIEELCEKYDAELVRFDPPSSYKTRIKLISYAKNDYIWFIDCDDTIRPNSVDLLEDFILTNSDVYIFGFTNLLKKEVVPATKRLLKGKEILNDFYSSDSIPNSLFAKLIKKAVLDTVSFPDIDIFQGDDLVISFFALKECSSLEFVPLVLYNYDLNTFSASKNVSWTHFCNMVVSTSVVSNKFYDKNGILACRNRELLSFTLKTFFLMCINGHLPLAIEQFSDFSSSKYTQGFLTYYLSVSRLYRKQVNLKYKIEAYLFDQFRRKHFRWCSLIIGIIRILRK